MQVLLLTVAAHQTAKFVVRAEDLPRAFKILGARTRMYRENLGAQFFGYKVLGAQKRSKMRVLRLFYPVSRFYTYVHAHKRLNPF